MQTLKSCFFSKMCISYSHDMFLNIVYISLCSVVNVNVRHTYKAPLTKSQKHSVDCLHFLSRI